MSQFIIKICTINQGIKGEIFQRINSERITLKDAESMLIWFRNELHLLKNTTARKNTYIEKKSKVLKNAEVLFNGQKLICNRFMDSMFGKHLKNTILGSMVMMTTMVIMVIIFTLHKK